MSQCIVRDLFPPPYRLDGSRKKPELLLPHHTGGPPPSCWAKIRAVDSLQRDPMCACDGPPDLEHAGRWPINWLWQSTSTRPIVTIRVVSRPGQTRTSRHYTTEFLKDTDTVSRVLTRVGARGESLPLEEGWRSTLVLLSK